MIALSISIAFCAVLYYVDKHGQWKWFLRTLGAIGLGIALLFGLALYKVEYPVTSQDWFEQNAPKPDYDALAKQHGGTPCNAPATLPKDFQGWDSK